MRARPIITLLILLALAVAACGGGETTTGESPAENGAATAPGAETPAEETEDAQAGGGEPVIIGSIHPLTGALALDGTQMDNAVKMAVEDINAAGELPYTLEVRSADTQGEAELGQSEAQRLIEEGAIALVGAFQSAVTTNIATVAARQQVPLVIDVAVADAITSEANDYVFRIQPNATGMGTFGAEYLAAIAEDSGTPVSTIAYMYDQSEFGTSVFEAFEARASELGMEIVEAIAYDPFGSSDFTTQIQQVAAADPDVLAVTGYYNDGVIIAENAMTVQPDLLAIYGVANGAFDLPQFPQDAGEAAAWIFDSNYHFDATKERVNEIRQRFQETYGEEMRTAAVLAYQAVEVIAQALANVESPDPVALRDAIQNVEVTDPLLTFPGPIQFDDSGENVNARPVVMQVQNEEPAQVYPEEFAEQAPVFPAVPWAPPE